MSHSKIICLPQFINNALEVTIQRETNGVRITSYHNDDGKWFVNTKFIPMDEQFILGFIRDFSVRSAEEFCLKFVNL